MVDRNIVESDRALLIQVETVTLEVAEDGETLVVVVLFIVLCVVGREIRTAVRAM